MSAANMNLPLGVWVSKPHPKQFEGALGLFFDRDGVIVREVNYLCRVEDVELLDGATEIINLAQASGLAVVTVTNQAGIDRDCLTGRPLRPKLPAASQMPLPILILLSPVLFILIILRAITISLPHGANRVFICLNFRTRPTEFLKGVGIKFIKLGQRLEIFK